MRSTFYNYSKRIVISVAVLTIAILSLGIGIILFVPTAITNYPNTRIVEFAKKQLSRDLSICSNNVTFIAGHFSRESVIVFRVQNPNIPLGKFRQIAPRKQSGDYGEMVTEIMADCGVDMSAFLSETFFVFYGSDYSVIFLKAEADFYLIYLGAQ